MDEDLLRLLCQPGGANANELFEGEDGCIADLDEVNDIWHNRNIRSVYIIEPSKVQSFECVRQPGSLQRTPSDL